MGNNGYRCPEDKLLKGEGVITRFNVFVGRVASIGGSGCIEGEHGEVLVNFANLFFGHVRPRQVDGFDTYEGIRVKYVALPVNRALGFSLAKAIRVEPIENGDSNSDDHRNNRVSRRKERPSKIGDPRFTGGTD
ncbi:MAG: hypothetical protein A2758_00060 [Candidatus Zambryskibacteria bacterium RIFCSPHIGHO2_01_FULL_49_18]|uniref:Uncharacterized protein n=2 Tax=Parcubacteria group TaxID=1794811 RepID=A0A1G2T399_9BACT|nr:MAG: hypothetical protein A2941_02365 [Candidatus Yanofskybacteria bacterium RIFCSPLOWO2_01_FULL_49_17]OHA91733.1 MAG: hypothetical protein A2758_00060 [Candidatus Zambryskibacteria bacterium RIFCSPHIGHO2_01_FULL_49_18]